MPFTFKLSQRLARMRGRVCAAMAPALAACLAVSACERFGPAPTGPGPQLAQIVVLPESLTVAPAQQVQFVAYGRTSAGDSTSASVSWSTSGGSIASNGSYTADTGSGDFMVTAMSTQSGVSGSSRVRVRKVKTVTVSPPTATVALGQTVQLTATLRDASGSVLTGRTVTWSSSNLAVATGSASVTVTAPSGAPECATPQPGWIWCDDFEQNRLSQYFEYDSAGGSFVRVTGVGVGGSYGMRVRFALGQVEAGSLHLAMGKVPDPYFRTVDAGTALYRDVYWRMYVRTQPGWVGGSGYKLSRAISFATSTWAEAMMAHLWGDPPATGELLMDPASGTDAAGNLKTTKYNDFANFRWLGALSGVTPLFDASHVGQWYCVEAHAQLNDAGSSNGVFEFWINGNLDARETGLNWVGSYSAYAINALFFENYWNTGSPAAQERYFDNIVISTQRIGC